MNQMTFDCVLAVALLALLPADGRGQQVNTEIVSAVPDTTLLRRPFDAADADLFLHPAKGFYPETWFHYVNGNVDREGITEDLEAIAASGIAGVQFFHGGGFSDGWKGVTDPVYCLTDKWEDLVKHTASEAQRLGLRFTLQNCPGWAMSGGPWIDLDHCMRVLSYRRFDVEGGTSPLGTLAVTTDSLDDWRDICVLAFPTPLDDVVEPLFSGKYSFQPTTADEPHVIEVMLDAPAMARTLEFCSINAMNHPHSVDPHITVRVEAVADDGESHEVLSAPLPRSNWQDNHTLSLPLSEWKPCRHYRVNIVNAHSMNVPSVRLLSAARQPDWEAEAGHTLRSLFRPDSPVTQSSEAYVHGAEIKDLTDLLNTDGTLRWQAPEGTRWTVLRIGHVNARQQNGPAPAEATGWECDKLSPAGADTHFEHYVGHLAGGPLKGMVSNMLMDSWECYSQTWTAALPDAFMQRSGYALRRWMPALFGFVIDDTETTARFLVDWRRTLNDLYVNSYFGEMAHNAHAAGLTISYETAAGDITPADPMEYYKHADVPMCEFWQPFSHWLSNRNFKPILPTASAAHMYGKPRVSAESFTSFDLTWDEHLGMLRDVANQNLVDGMTHFVFHTYTHNPGATRYYPGTSFGSSIGTPFLRGETWWKHMPAFTTCLARTTYMLERGVPVNSVLWYIGDEPQHKPDQFAAFPDGYRYDYCNPDALLSRLTVVDGEWSTPEGIRYPLLWIPERGRMLPETLERLVTLVREGGVLVADAPTGMATLSVDHEQQKRYDAAVHTLFPSSGYAVRRVGEGCVLSGFTIDEALAYLDMQPDVQGLGNRWVHRRAEGADWYFVCADREQPFDGEVTFRCKGNVQRWNTVDGTIHPVTVSRATDEYTTIPLHLAVGESAFIVFSELRDESGKTRDERRESTTLSAPWTLTFPEGWGIDATVVTDSLQPWRALNLTDEGRAFAGTATYTTTIRVPALDRRARYILHLGKVEMIAVVRLNGHDLGTLWTEPYDADITSALHPGTNTLEVEVTSSWFNRLVYDAGQPEEQRKTWVLSGPSAKAPLRDNGLMGPVTIEKMSRRNVSLKGNSRLTVQNP